MVQRAGQDELATLWIHNLFKMSELRVINHNTWNACQTRQLHAHILCPLYFLESKTVFFQSHKFQTQGSSYIWISVVEAENICSSEAGIHLHLREQSRTNDTTGLITTSETRQVLHLCETLPPRCFQEGKPLKWGTHRGVYHNSCSYFLSSDATHQHVQVFWGYLSWMHGTRCKVTS